MPTRQKPKQDPTTPAYNQWEFLRDFCNHFFGLFNSGQIYPAFGLFVLGIIALVFFRLPGDQLPGVIGQIIEALQGSVGLAYALLAFSNVLWVWHGREQKGKYLAEINRLAAIRKALMHGTSPVIIKEHRSSTGQQEESYLMPTNPDATDPNEGKS
ncbi:MAG: hypothetical protein AW12_00835 [Candidatus Accumulibacter sp. BA-94]|uniref:hypothetical protein n=1 Tax=Accumulibacter sp. TaxID=2053492 RepID=UPI00044BEB1F|nr:hypothetical protein [Accumulibacter sp.]EXI92092.1 MAG: hypothetical protein AW12_00835 [Candidatus Accumulibacter sp. BA-94]